MNLIPFINVFDGNWYIKTNMMLTSSDDMVIPSITTSGTMPSAAGRVCAIKSNGELVIYSYDGHSDTLRLYYSFRHMHIPYSSGNILHLTKEGILELVSSDNKILWQATQNGKVVIAGEKAHLVFQSEDGKLVLYNDLPGPKCKSVWSFTYYESNTIIVDKSYISKETRGWQYINSFIHKRNIENLYLDVSTTLNKTIFYCKEKGPWIDIYAIDNITNKIYKNANMWLYMLYQSKDQQQQLADYETTYNDIIHNMNINLEYVNCNVIQFMSTFSKGTVHGYAALIYTLTEYINNDYGDYKILVYKDSQKGMIEIINHFVKLNFIDKNNIIYIESCIAYLFNVIKFIPVPLEWHALPRDEHHNQVTRPRGGAGIDIISKYMIEQIEIESYDICIVKHNKSEKLTFRGEEETDYNILVDYCKKNNLFLLEPGTLNEILLVNYLYRCKKFVTSWGTSFFKNMGYLSSSCKKIIVIINEEGYFGEYTDEKNSGYLMKEYNGIPIEYYRADKYINLQRLE